jgi:hypothetical protein
VRCRKPRRAWAGGVRRLRCRGVLGDGGAGREARAGLSGALRAAQEKGSTCPERDDAHPGSGHDLLGAVEGVTVEVEVAADGADGDGDGGVEQEQEPEHRLAVE